MPTIITHGAASAQGFGLFKGGVKLYLYMSGSNTNGALGLNDVVNRSSATQVGALTTWDKILCGGYSSYAIKKDKTLWAWGRNDGGSLGDGTYSNKSSPVQIGSQQWDFVSANANLSVNTTFALGLRGTDLYAWGYGNEGQIGNSLTSGANSPIFIGSSFSKVSAGNQHSLAVKTNGTLWSWGANNAGQLGYSGANKSSPTQVGTATNWAYVAGGQERSFGIKTDGTLWAWGNGASGALGNNSIANVTIPQQIGSLTNWAAVASCPGSYNVTLAVKTDGTLWSWGGSQNMRGQVGSVEASSPVQVGSLTTWSKVFTGGRSVFALKTDGTLWGWGDNNNGELGLNNVTGYNSPVQIGTTATYISAAMGVNFGGFIR